MCQSKFHSDVNLWKFIFPSKCSWCKSFIFVSVLLTQIQQAGDERWAASRGAAGGEISRRPPVHQQESVAGQCHLRPGPNCEGQADEKDARMAAGTGDGRVGEKAAGRSFQEDLRLLWWVESEKKKKLFPIRNNELGEIRRWRHKFLIYKFLCCNVTSYGQTTFISCCAIFKRLAFR